MRSVENGRYILRRNVERYRLLLGHIANPTLRKLLQEMIAEAEAQLARFDAPSRTERQGAASMRDGAGRRASGAWSPNVGSDPQLPGTEEWQLDPESRSATTPAGKAVQLTKGEYELLLALVTHADQTLSREDLMALLRHRSEAPNERTIDVLIGRLRRKLEVDPRHPGYITTVRSLGYLFKARLNINRH